MLPQEKQNEVIAVLQARLSKNGRRAVCPMCGNDHFTMADSYLLNQLITDFKSVPLGGPALPTLAILCTNCGFVSQHALGILGLLPQEASSDKK